MNDETPPDARWLRILEGLEEEPPDSAIQTLSKGGTKLSYLDVNYCIRKANDLFDVGGWEQRIVAPPYLLYTSHEERKQQGGPDRRDVYACVVRVIIQGDGGALIETEGAGTCGQMGPGQDAAEMAIKGAASDALKRALAPLGRAFGLGLRKGADVEVPEEPEEPESPVTVAVKAFARELVKAELTTVDGDGVIKPRFDALIESKILTSLSKASIHDLVVEHSAEGLVKFIRTRLAVAEKTAEEEHEPAEEEQPPDAPAPEEDEDLT